MHRKVSGRAALAALALAISCTMGSAWSAAPAAADSGSGSCGDSAGGGSSGGGSGSGGDFQIWLALSSTRHLCSGGGNAASTDGTDGTSVYVPCWWGPVYSPGGLQAYVDSLGESAIDTQFDYMHEYDVNGDAAGYTAGYTSTAGPPWESYNVNATPSGEWYGMIFNGADTGPQWDACNAAMDADYPKVFYWGVNGPPADLPGNAPGFTEQDLAEYIESVVLLPHAQVESSQGKGTDATVGLPIWYWQTEGTAHTHLKFGVCAFQVCVTFNADAVSFTIDPGADAGQAWDGGCTPQSTNTLGPVYDGQSASQDPTCGEKYSAITTGVTPTIGTKWHVSITWDTDGGGSWSPPKDPVIYTQLGPFDVQGIQAYNQATSTPTS